MGKYDFLGEDYEDDNYEDSYDDGYSENNNEEQQEEQVQEEPVGKLSRGKTVIVVIGLLIVLLIAVITIHSCSVQKKVTTSEPIQTAGYTEQNVAQNYSEVPVETQEIYNYSAEVTPTSDGINTFVNSDVNVQQEVYTEPEVITNGLTLTEVSNPSLSDIFTAQGVVFDKKQYLFNDSYIYNIVLMINISEDQIVQTNYFCPKKTFDALYVPAPLQVEYQYDEYGRVSVNSISN